MGSAIAEQPPGALSLAGVYIRELEASVERVWENVFDWEHLPSLHSSTFARVELIDSHPQGNRLRLTNPFGDPGKAQVIELEADPEAGRYVVTTREGVGVGSQIRTRLTQLGPHRTRVEVEFHIPESRPERLAAIGGRYAETYARLWDEDEAMMMQREAALMRRRDQRAGAPPTPLHLGDEQTVRSQLPFTIDFGGERFRVIDVDGEIMVHAADCPHWLGPLDEVPVVDGCVRCPWHGYLFDVRSGRSADGRRLKLATPPQVHIENGSVMLQSGSGSGSDRDPDPRGHA